MKIAIIKETAQYERRVAGTPESIKKLLASGLEVLVQKEAGMSAGYPDSDYEKAGGKIISNTEQLLEQADLILKVQKPTEAELNHLKPDKIWISFLQPFQETGLLQILSQKKVTAFAMEMIPRIARAQKCDALSSQSNIAGYKAVIMAANKLRKIFPMMMTAAGTIHPAKIVVIGAGVAGLQAIATAHRLGAVVEAYDTRPVVREQVESLGGKFIEVELLKETAEDKGGYAKELSAENQKNIQKTLTRHIQSADAVITTAAIPGKSAPKIITEPMIQGMKPGSVIVDLAAESGGNCVLTEPGKETIIKGITLVGTFNIPSLMAPQSSHLYANNCLHFLMELIQEGTFNVNLEDELIQGALVTYQGKIVHPQLKENVKAE